MFNKNLKFLQNLFSSWDILIKRTMLSAILDYNNLTNLMNKTTFFRVNMYVSYFLLYIVDCN